MTHALRFQTLILPNTDWSSLKGRFLHAERLGFDLAVTADHFVDWSNPPSPWFDLWTVLAAVAEATTTIRLAPCVGQIPLRTPAMFAREALSVELISNGRLEVGLGLGLPMDPSYEMMGIPNWSNPERARRFTEYVEVVSALLSQEVTSYSGKYYSVDGAYMNPRPIQAPRPPITIAAMGPKMLGIAAQYADSWNTMSFATTFSAQVEETRTRVEQVAAHCERLGRDVASLRHSFNLFDPDSRRSGGMMACYESEQRFTDIVSPLLELGFNELGLYYPMRPEQMDVFERIATDIFPAMRAAHS